MAGSYLMLCASKNIDDEEEDLDYLGPFTFDFIENLGDAWEACEMCHWMIQWLADGNGDRIRAAEEAYFHFLRSR